jgi:hypothetical protein
VGFVFLHTAIMIADLKTQHPYMQQVSAVLAEHELLPMLQNQDLPQLIAAHQAQGLCQMTTALVISYTVSLELQQQGSAAAAQTLYNQARHVHEQLSRQQSFTAFDSVEFTSQIAASRSIRQRMTTTLPDVV